MCVNMCVIVKMCTFGSVYMYISVRKFTSFFNEILQLLGERTLTVYTLNAYRLVENATLK